ncbi:uncharacterized protein LOC125057798 isoform X1 [Pieris napi]|uniref:uncharacterized protein LOC125057798 isoform X1 n=2 Tax=Pieris napi TaxID=78633 RepID=UPI001FB91D97|nr:uncharacterized protein LOC125057798 isoform X1 [Pieris napi]
MGSGLSSANSKRRKESQNAESSRVLFLLYLIHRTWNVLIEHVDSKSARWRRSQSVPSSGELGRQFDSISFESSGSCYSSCSCSYCRLRDCAHDCVSELTQLEGMANCAGWSEEPISKEKQRPPIYNPEDYATSLKKWGKKTSGGNLYDVDPGQDPNKARTLPSQGSKDFRNPCLGVGEEMSLRQFCSPSELLTKLRADLRLSFPSFVQEFASEPLDGVTLLLELLRNVQLSQTGDGARGPPAVRRRPLLDELACLQCLWSCCTRYSECVRRLVACSNGVYALAVCIMSTVNKSRILALQLLTKACEPPAHGHSMISEALSTLRLRYGEPVRFRFLVGMLQSTGGSGDLQAAGLAFINSLLTSAPSPQRKLYIQAELEQAGFDVVTLKKIVAKLPNPNEYVVKEIENYERQLIDIDTLSEKATEAQKEKDDLRLKLELLEKRVKILQEEKGILLSLEKCLKEKCCELQEEVSTLRSEHSTSSRKKTFVIKKKNSTHRRRDESSPPEDEGISSSERSLSPEGDPQRESMVYEVFNIKNETYDLLRNKRPLHKKLESTKNHKKSTDDEEEATIDEVIQELRNIVNHAESEQYLNRTDSKCKSNRTSETDYQKDRSEEKEDSITSTRHSIHITSSNEFEDSSDEIGKIVPSKIFPQPPNKNRSLSQLFPHVEKGLLFNKSQDFFDMYCSSDEGSDSLLSVSRCRRVMKNDSITSFDFSKCRAKFNETDTDDNKLRRSKTREDSRKPIVKRSESLQSEKGSRQREYIESMFESHSSLIEPSPLQRSGSKCSRVDEIVNLIESKKLTKSLDRIDEGLNSMVDIIMVPETKKTTWSYEKRQRSVSRANSEIEEPPLMPRTSSRTHSYEYKEDKSDKYSTARTTGSFDTNFNNTFMMKRGSNTGFYSGAPMLRDAPASMTSLVTNGTHSYGDMKRTFSPISSSYGLNKVTDMPSGLY